VNEKGIRGLPYWLISKSWE